MADGVFTLRKPDGSGFSHTYGNADGALSPIARENAEGTSRFGLQVLRENDYYWQIVDSFLQSQTRLWKWDVKTSDSSAIEISGKKVQLVAFLTVRGWMIYQLMYPPKQRINGDCTTMLKQLLVHIHRKCMQLVNSWILHQDNVPPHKARWVTKFLEEHNIEGMEHPLLQSGACPIWLLLFPAKKALRGWKFYFDRELLTAPRTFFNCLPEFQFCKTFEGKWSERMQKCIFSEDHYFEKERSKNKDVDSDSGKQFLIIFSPLKIVTRSTI